jgi:hypothetical protein
VLEELVAVVVVGEEPVAVVVMLDVELGAEELVVVVLVTVTL